MVLAAAASPVLLRADIDIAAAGGCQALRAGVEVGRRSCIGIAAVAGSTAAAAAAAGVHVACSSSAFVVEGVAVEMLAVLYNTAGYDEEGVVVEPGILIGEDIGALPQVEGYSAEFVAAV